MIDRSSLEVQAMLLFRTTALLKDKKKAFLFIRFLLFWCDPLTVANAIYSHFFVSVMAKKNDMVFLILLWLWRIYNYRY